MLSDTSILRSYKPLQSTVELADANHLDIVGESTVLLFVANGAVISVNTLHVSQLSSPLISLGRPYEKGCKIIRSSTSSFKVTFNNRTLFDASVVDGAFSISLKIHPRNSSTNVSNDIAL